MHREDRRRLDPLPRAGPKPCPEVEALEPGAQAVRCRSRWVNMHI